MMQYDKVNTIGTWIRSVRDGLPERLLRLWRWLRNWPTMVGMVVLVPVFLLASCTPVSAAPMTAKPVPTEVAEPVLCIGVVRDAAGGQYTFFQRGGVSLDQTLTEQGMAGLVRDGFTVPHRNCYEDWQGAADFLTDGAVTLPENATEQDFVQALMQWKQQGR